MKKPVRCKNFEDGSCEFGAGAGSAMILEHFKITLQLVGIKKIADLEQNANSSIRESKNHGGPKFQMILMKR